MSKCNREQAFKAVQGTSMVDPDILKSEAYEYVKKDFVLAISQGPDYECTVCFKLEFRRTVVTLNASRYDEKIYDQCYQQKTQWICKSCDKYMRKGKIPPQAQVNNMYLCPKFEELDRLSYLECMLISQIIPFMFIVAKQKSSQDGLKGQCVLVPADLKKIQTELPRTCGDNNIISLALKRRLSDRGAIHKQNINPKNVNEALEKLVNVNPLYANVRIDNSWESLSKDSDPVTWNMLTNPEADILSDETDTEDELENTRQTLEKRTTMNCFPTALQRVDGPSIDTNEILNIAPSEGQIPVSARSEPNWEPLAFPKEFSTGEYHFNHPRDIKLTPVQYVQTRLKCSDTRFSANPQYLFSCLDWTERNAIASAINFTQRKQFQSEINAGHLLNSDNMQRMIGEDQMYASFKSIRGTPQYFHNMMLDILAKIRQFGPPTFFLTCSAAEMGDWTEIIQSISHQSGIDLNYQQIKDMDWADKVKMLKRNPVTAARMIDDRFRQLFGKVLYSGMHPIGQILNHDERREFQSRGAEHTHAIIHVKDAPKLDEDDDSKITKFIDKYCTNLIPEKDDHPELHDFVTRLQTHKHTQTCRKKKGVKCRFNFPLPPSDETLIVRNLITDRETLKEKKKVLDKVLLYISDETDLSDVSIKDILSECDISEDDYYDALEYVQKEVAVVYKRRPCEQNVSTYNTVVLSLMKSNMNIQFVTGHYGVLKYLTSYMCKPERATSELMKKAAKEATNKGVQEKLYAIGNVFITKREVSTDEAIVRSLSLPMRSSKIDTEFLVTGYKENRTRSLKPRAILETMDPDDENVYAPNILDKYMHRPDHLKEIDNMCLADFATNYVHHSAYEPEVESDDIRNYTTAVSTTDIDIDDIQSKGEIITLKDEMGKMRKRKRPCVMRYHKVSKLKDSELYYFILLQLYLPWRNEDELKGNFSTYEERYSNVESIIRRNILKHDPYFEKCDMNLDDMLENQVDFDSEDDDGPENRSEFNFINPELLDYDTSDQPSNGIETPALSTIENRSISREMCYEMCSQLNEEQLQIFHYVMRYAVEYMLNERNDLILPEPIYVFLSGGAGVGKSYVSKVMIENLRNVLKFHLQDFSTQQSVVVTASTGIAATHLDGTTLHTAFVLPLKDRRVVQQGPALNALQRKYKFLRVLLTDEVSMTGIDTFDALNETLQKIKNNDSDFGGVSIIAVGDLLQLPPVKMAPLFSRIHSRINDPWYRLFKLHELIKIVRQSNDPEFASILSRLREGKQSDDDINEIKKLENTDTSSWPDEVIHLYITNHLADTQNYECLSRLHQSGETIVTVKSKDKGNLSVPGDLTIGKTGNLRKTLLVCEGAKVMITKNIDIDDKVVNGTLGTIKKLDRVGNDSYGYPKGRIYVKCDNAEAGNKLKDPRLRGELKECIPIKPEVQSFRYRSRDIERNQFPITLAHAMTTHKSQGNTLDYFIGDVNQSLGPEKKRSAPCGPGLFYTMVGRGKSRKKIKLLNFKESCIVVNKEALNEMERMRRECVLSCAHPLQKLGKPSIILYNIVSWNKHIKHFLSDESFALHSNVFCFTETNVSSTGFQKIHNYDLPTWDDIHEPIGHGLALCYNEEKVKVIQRFSYSGTLQLLPVLLRIENELVLIVLLYRPPGPIGTFVENLLQSIDQFTSEIFVQGNYRVIIVGDFNWDQMLPEHVRTFEPIITHFLCYQRSNYSTHIQGGILDLVFDTQKRTKVDWMFSPYSDHFILLIEL